MPKEEMGIKDQIHIVLRGPDGKVKDERKPKKEHRREYRDGKRKQDGD